MYKITIVEDSPRYSIQLREFLERYQAENQVVFQIDTYSGGLSFLDAYQPDQDLVLMDIEMPHMNGIETARRLRAVDPEVCLIFVTYMAKYALEGYEVQAMDFILKPLEYPGFAMKLKRALERRDRARARERELVVNTADGLRRVDIHDIYYVEVLNHTLVYCACNHEYYSEDAMLTNLMAVAVCKGGERKGLMMEAKHLAFNHQEMKRVGVSTFITEQAGREGDLRGFRGVCSGNYTKGVMTAYNRVGDVYTGGSKALQTDILRREWGYTGWIVTDMAVPPEYMNWREAVYGGGCSVLTATTFAQGQIGTMESRRDEILSDAEFQRKMKDGIKYYLYTFAGSNAMNGITGNTERVYVRTWWQNALRGAEIGLGVLAALCAILMFVTKRERS